MSDANEKQFNSSKQKGKFYVQVFQDKFNKEWMY